MITRSKWEPKKGMQAGEISADAVTGDLKTQENALPFLTLHIGNQERFRRSSVGDR